MASWSSNGFNAHVESCGYATVRVVLGERCSPRGRGESGAEALRCNTGPDPP